MTDGKKFDGKSPGAYVRKVRRDTQRYLEDLLADNQKLRMRAAGLESVTAKLERERSRLEDEIQLLRKERDRDQKEYERLRQQLDDLEGESRSYAERYVEVEQHNTNLANLYVAGYSLHGTLDRENLLTAVREIIINLVGCEELAIFELIRGASAPPEGGDRDHLRLISSSNIDAEKYRRLPISSGLIGRAVRTGETFFADGSDDGDRSPAEARLTACIPLEVDGRVSGAIAIFRLLPQKTEGLGVLDHELFDLLAQQAGIALYAAALHARFATEEDPAEAS